MRRQSVSRVLVGPNPVCPAAWEQRKHMTCLRLAREVAKVPVHTTASMQVGDVFKPVVNPHRRPSENAESLSFTLAFCKSMTGSYKAWLGLGDPSEVDKTICTACTYLYWRQVKLLDHFFHEDRIHGPLRGVPRTFEACSNVTNCKNATFRAHFWFKHTIGTPIFFLFSWPPFVTVSGAVARC